MTREEREKHIREIMADCEKFGPFPAKPVVAHGADLSGPAMDLLKRSAGESSLQRSLDKLYPSKPRLVVSNDNGNDGSAA